MKDDIIENWRYKSVLIVFFIVTWHERTGVLLKDVTVSTRNLKIKVMGVLKIIFRVIAGQTHSIHYEPN